MDKTTKQILIDLVEYHKGILYTPDALGMTLQDIATRAVAALAQENQRSKRAGASVDPFAMDVVTPQPLIKKETDW
jgi:hypothetical protein